MILIGMLFLFAFNVNAQTASNPYFNYKGKLIIIGGGSIPDSLFEFFAAHCGGKDQPLCIFQLRHPMKNTFRRGDI